MPIAYSQTNFPDAALLQKAQGGNAKAQAEVGKIYREGRIGFPADYFTAYDWFHKAEQQGNAEAMYQIGNMYENGEIGPVDFRKDPQNYSEYLNAITNINYEKALNWYIKAADKNHIKAYDAVMHIYKMEMQNGKKVTPNNAEVRKWNQKWDQNAVNIYKQKADNGDGDAMIELFWVYMRGLYNVKADKNEAQKWYDKALENADISRLSDRVEPLYFGNKQEQEEAVRLFSQAAEKNNPLAQYFLGRAYAEGKGIKKDAIEAVKLFNMAGESGDEYVQFQIWEMYTKGKIVKKDATETAKWLRMLEENENAAYFQYRIGKMYALGKGAKKDEAEATKWFSIAAKNGSAYVQFMIGQIFATGIVDGLGDFKKKGINKVEAAKCFRMAAENGNAIDQYRVAQVFYSGYFVEKDYAEAFKWAYKAVMEGRLMFTPANNYFADPSSPTKWWYVNACQLLGAMYREGQGVQKDEKEADKWSINLKTSTNPMILASQTERLNKFCDEWNARWRKINP